MNTTSPLQCPNALLAMHGGMKAFMGKTGRSEPKIGTAEFIAIAKRFGYTPQAIERISSVVSDSDLLGGGPNLARYCTAYPEPAQGEVYEQVAKDKFGVPFARAVSSGTGSLHAAMVAVGVGPGKEVIVPAMGFLATAVSVIAAGGMPVFCDVDASLQIDPSKIEALITSNTVAIAPTHHWGTVCDMVPIMEIARRHHLRVVEDCAQSPGAKYRGQYVGTIGDIGCFSISAYKIIGGGEGGLVLTKDQRLFDRMSQVIECGGLWRSARFAPERYDGELFVGTNYRMSELEAAVDVVQLSKLDDIVRRYHQISRRILKQLHEFKTIQMQSINDAQGEIGYMIRFFPKTIEFGHQISDALRAEGIPASMHNKRHPDWHYYADMLPVLLHTHRHGEELAKVRGRAGDCPVADDLWFRHVTISVDQWWNESDADHVAQGINKVLFAYCQPDKNATQ